MTTTTEINPAPLPADHAQQPTTRLKIRSGLRAGTSSILKKSSETASGTVQNLK